MRAHVLLIRARREVLAASLYCRNCGTRLPSESPFCPECGASQSTLNYLPTAQTPHEPSDGKTGKLPAGHLLHNRYRLLDAVGRGGMGAVYVAQDTQLGERLVAVKEMSMSRLTAQELPRATEQFKREAHLLAGLHHPHLPVIYEYFGEGERWYLVMSFIEGGTLQTSLDAVPGNNLPVNEVVRIGIELCEVLDYLHTHQPQIVFRDLKPSNIMFTPKGQVYLIDFGIARNFKQNQAKDTAYYYSAGYAPPEQYGQSQTSPRSDIYSLGATLHQMLSGHNPSSKPFQFPALQLLDPTVPMPLAKLITQMLEMNEEQRPASVVEVKERLEEVSALELVKESKKGGDAKKQEPSRNEIADGMLGSKPKKGDAEKKQEPRPEPGPIVGTNETSQGLWSTINDFFVKRRIPAWVCFIVLNLIIVVAGIQLSGEESPSNGIWLALAGAGAGVVGWFFLLAKGWPRVDILGGIALALCGNLALLTFLSPTVAECGTIYFSDPNSNAACRVTILSLSYPTLILSISIVLLLLGTRFFLRQGNTTGGLIFGVCLMIAGIVVAGLLGASATYGYSGLSAIPGLGAVNLIGFLPGVLGVAAIIVTFLRRRNKPRGQN